MSYLNDDFLLTSKTAKRLFHEVAANQPIFDYHTHLPPEEVAGNARFGNLADIWLGGDHYKWRAMRAAGEPEELITGTEASPREKFDAWARTIPQTVRNPLHNWTHLELKRYFNCDLILSPETADDIWNIANEQLSDDSFRTHNILKKFKVQAVGTTDDPVDDLQHHIAFAEDAHPTSLCPTFRPDKAMIITSAAEWNEWTTQLSETSGVRISSAASFLDALKARHDFFHQSGGRFSDHDINHFPYAACSDEQAEGIYTKLVAEEPLSALEAEQWWTYVLQHVARWNAARGWAMQFHIGVIRRPNSRIRESLGADTGHDSIYDNGIIEKMAPFLDSLDKEEALPKCIFYHVNPAMLYPIAVLMGAFQDGRVAGKMQLGSGWWFLDTIHGMRTQMETLSSVGLLSKFVGMLTDSRSFLSFPRHEYFRRILCDLIANDVDNGLIPNDTALLEQLVRGICYDNAVNYFNIPKK
ncbi:glucuronate isomerase [Coraliomargarita akajimensis]|uniref:Uronate isomerase n=1 Tax=Coraliomargarita akajimensis (strain DSM 45221 / IAM 15411 / JCM 23193 / KCTC 12865 / 04OKA010-24) TaxID=583355 RepID=D5EQQ9_CORAD|nr:glucuronate isomerase [Coraliomargarita akajimensis]ADE55873.1 Glucuronate isomerase [Coraliomargarita akajimensis DSM 45221]